MMRSVYARVAVAAAVLVMSACERVQLLAPTNSTITVSAPNRVLPLGGSTEVTAFVTEQSGTPVQNGTVVRFTSTLGSVTPPEVETRNGLAISTFLAGNTSGIAEVRATSGGATGGTTTTGTGTTATTSTTNVIQITIGAAAVNTVTLRANPGTVSATGGTVELIANVVGENGRALEGIAVTFNTDQGTLSAPVATTNSSGEARTSLTTAQKASVTATAGTKTSTPATVVDVRAGPGVSITCTPAAGTGNCAAVQASATGNTATVLFTVAKGTSTSNLRSVTIDFGDGTSQSLGNLAGGSATVSHTYAGPSSTSPRAYTAAVVAVDINGETSTASTAVNITPRATPTPITLSFTADSCATATSQGQRCTFTVSATGGGEGGTGNATIESYSWDFGDGTEATTSSPTISHIYTSDGRYTVTSTARTADGRTARAQTEIIIDVP
jgi:hypothetical protein